MDNFYLLLQQNITKGNVKNWAWLNNFDTASVELDLDIIDLSQWAQGKVQEVIKFAKEMMEQDFLAMARHYDLNRKGGGQPIKDYMDALQSLLLHSRENMQSIYNSHAYRSDERTVKSVPSRVSTMLDVNNTEGLQKTVKQLWFNQMKSKLNKR